MKTKELAHMPGKRMRARWHGHVVRVMGDILFLLVTISSTASLSIASGMPAPARQEFFSYNAISFPVLNEDPSQARPVGVGSAADGGDIVSLNIGLSQFTEPVDIYFGIFAPVLDAANIYLLTEQGFQTLSAGLKPWKRNLTEGINEKILGDIPVSSLPEGTYTLYLLITPSANLGRYYLWTTSLDIRAIPSQSRIGWDIRGFDASGYWVNSYRAPSGDQRNLADWVQQYDGNWMSILVTWYQDTLQAEALAKVSTREIATSLRSSQ